MSEIGTEDLSGSVGSYWQALREVVIHIYHRLKFLHVAYERIKPVRALPRPVRSVLFVCKGNICRSPLAEVYFLDKARREGYAVTVKSAGIETTPGKPAHKLAKEIARQIGTSLENHATTSLHPNLIYKSDLIFVMEVGQKYRLSRMYPEVKQKVFLLGQFCNRGSIEIDDPYCGTQEDFRVCFERIRSSCDRVFQEIGEQQKGPEEIAEGTPESESPVN